MTSTLTPEGAQWLRKARDYIQSHPEELTLRSFRSIGNEIARYCIAGHVCRLAGHRVSGWQAAEILGFDSAVDYSPTSRVRALFYGGLKEAGEIESLAETLERINMFLDSYGYVR